jgi:hypothetical protein
MPIHKPLNDSAVASLHTLQRARDGAANRSMAQNAALGLDNFARLLRNSPASSVPGASGQAPGKLIMREAGVKEAGFTVPEGMAAGRLGLDFSDPALRQLQNMSVAQKAMRDQSQTLPSSGRENGRLKGSEAAVLALRTAGHRLKEVTAAVAESLGKLSSLFESGSQGSQAIGYDEVGGTSYGKYQIASNTGTMDEFITFLKKRAPEAAARLKAAGPANTGGKEGGMPEVWRALAGADPKGFAALEHEFISNKLFVPALTGLNGSGLDTEKLSPVMREVIFSTAVQHGPSAAARITRRALERIDPSRLLPPDGKNTPDSKQAEQLLIRRIYAIRREQFSSSSGFVQKAVQNRLQSEMDTALLMSKGERV